jgi:heptosyltransferase-3
MRARASVFSTALQPLKRAHRRARQRCLVIWYHRRVMYWSLYCNILRFAWLRLKFSILSPRRDLVVINLLEHFGDIIACEPVPRHVRSILPSAYIVWTVRAAYSDLLAHNPHVDRTIQLHCLTEWISLRRWPFFDRIIDLHVAGRVCPSCKVPLTKSTAPHITIDTYYHFGTLLGTFSQSAGLEALSDAPQMHAPPLPSGRLDALGLPDSFVTIHCTSNEQVRDWTPDKWLLLVDRLISELRVHVVEIGTSAAASCRSPLYHDLCGRLSLLETAEVIRRAILFIGIDSGPAHMANAFQTPGIVVLGRYRTFKRYLPYTGYYADPAADALLYAENDDVAATIPVTRVYAAARDKLLRHYPSFSPEA